MPYYTKLARSRVILYTKILYKFHTVPNWINICRRRLVLYVAQLMLHVSHFTPAMRYKLIGNVSYFTGVLFFKMKWAQALFETCHCVYISFYTGYIGRKSEGTTLVIHVIYSDSSHTVKSGLCMCRILTNCKFHSVQNGFLHVPDCTELSLDVPLLTYVKG